MNEQSRDAVERLKSLCGILFHSGEYIRDSIAANNSGDTRLHIILSSFSKLRTVYIESTDLASSFPKNHRAVSLYRLAKEEVTNFTMNYSISA